MKGENTATPTETSIAAATAVLEEGVALLEGLEGRLVLDDPRARGLLLQLENDLGVLVEL